MALIKAWSFLVGRNRHLDYRTIVAPDFLCESKSITLLARATDGEMTATGQALLRHVVGTNSCEFSIIYQVIKATSMWLDPEVGEEILKDSFGREIYLIKGLVFKDVKPDLFNIKQEHLDHVHFSLIEAYRRFWDAEEPPSVIPSHMHQLAENLPGLPLKLLEVPQFKIRTAPDSAAVNLSMPERDADGPRQHFSDSVSDDRSRGTDWLHPRCFVAYAVLALVIVSILFTSRFFFFRKSENFCKPESLPPIAISLDSDVFKALQIWQSNNNVNDSDPVLIVLSGDLHINKRLPPKALNAIRQSIKDAEKSIIKRGSITFVDYRLRFTDYPLNLLLKQSDLKDSLYVVKEGNIRPKKFASANCVGVNKSTSKPSLIPKL